MSSARSVDLRRVRQPLVYYHDPSTMQSHLFEKLGKLAQAVPVSVVADIGHHLFVAVDNRKRAELGGKAMAWWESLGWQVLRSLGGPVLVAIFTKEIPSALRSPRSLISVLACWAAVTFSPRDLIYRLYLKTPIRVVGHALEALWKSLAVSEGVDRSLVKLPEYRLASVAMGMISGCGGTMLMNWAQRQPLVYAQRKVDWIVKACFYASVIYALPTGEGIPKAVSNAGLKLLFTWAYVWRALFRNGDIFRPLESLVLLLAKTFNDLSDSLWHL